MVGRARSPNYPSTALEQAIDFIEKIHKIERTNPMDREVAAKALGYSGISGRSATILSNLIQYGLLSKAGKNEVRVTDRAVEIMYPDSPQSKADALISAAKEPELFQRVMERFTDGMPSSNALESFFVKEGFTDTAIPAAINAYQETFSFLRNAIERESYGSDVDHAVKSPLNQIVEGESAMQHQAQTPTPENNLAQDQGNPKFTKAEEGPEIHFAQKRIWLGGVISTRLEAQELINTITALMPMLQDVVSSQPEDEDIIG